MGENDSLWIQRYTERELVWNAFITYRKFAAAKYIYASMIKNAHTVMPD